MLLNDFCFRGGQKNEDLRKVTSAKKRKKFYKKRKKKQKREAREIKLKILSFKPEFE